MGQRGDLPEAGAFYGWNDDLSDARFFCITGDPDFLPCKFGGVKMTMGIDPHDREY